MSGSVLDNCDDDNENIVKGFHVSLTWDYPDNNSLQDVINTVFHALDYRHAPRSESQFISNCIQASGTGILLSQPSLEMDPCELQLNQSLHLFHVTKLLVVSEAKHVELFLNHIYAKTSKGCMVSAKKGKKLALYENEFDLTNQTTGIKNIKIKFVSLSENFSMRLQMVMLWVMPVSKLEKQMIASNGTNLSNIQDMVKSIGMFVSEMEDGKEFSDMSYLERQTHISDKKEHIETIQNLMQLTGIKNERNIDSDCKNNNIHSRNFNSGFSESNSRPSSALSFAIAHSKPGELKVVGNDDDDEEELVTYKGNNIKKSKQKYSDEGFDGYGTPNPPNESVLANAILNQEAAKHIAASKASAIEEQNIQQAQEELENFNAENKPSHNGSYAPEKPPRKLAPNSSKRRPHSFAAPSPSEQDFTNLLSNLMIEESEQLRGESSGSDEQLSNKDIRWQAYLRSRIRASQRMKGKGARPLSSISLPAQNIQGNHPAKYFDLPAPNPQGNYTINRFDSSRASINSHNSFPYNNNKNMSRSSSFNYGSTKNFPISRSEENCSTCQSLLANINMNIKASEDRIKSYIDEKLNDLRLYFDDRLDAEQHSANNFENRYFSGNMFHPSDHFITPPQYYHVPNRQRGSKSSIV